MSPWILAIRPRTLPASLSPVILGLAFNAKINMTTASITALCALLLQIASNLINDYYDGISGIDSVTRLGPTRVTQSGLISKNAVKFAFVGVMTTALTLGIYLMYIGGMPIIVIGVLSLLFAFMYTGGPYPLSHFPLGEILAFVFFGPIAVWGTTYLQNPDTGSAPILIGFGPGFISAAIMSINNLRDIRSDQAVNKKTVAVLLGESKARSFTMLLFSASISVPVLLSIYYLNPWFLTPLATTIIVIPQIKVIKSETIDQRLNKALAATGKYMFAYSVAICALIRLHP